MPDQISLNKQQLQAIKHKSGPLLIIAGAGTGKTTVITERIKYLTQTHHVTPDQILAVTFTDKAAREMLERLDVVMPLGYQEPWLSTFHSFCDRILRDESLEIGLDPSYKILPSANQWILIRKHLFNFKLRYYRPLGNPTKFISALLTFFSRAQDEDISPEELIKYAKNFSVSSAKFSALSDSNTHSEDKKVFQEEKAKLLEVAEAFATYQLLKLKQSVLDFGDLITLTLKLFRTRPSILKKYRDQFRHILVDEFQDTNSAQFELIKLLAPAKSGSDGPNLVVVGDDDQSIYKFRGAAISNILEFKNCYPKARKIILTRNYRSLKPILNAAYKLIQHNNPDRLEVKLSLNKQLTPTRRAPRSLGEVGYQPQIVSLPTEDSETDWVIQKILGLVAQETYTFKDFAILTRANSQLEPFVSAFKRHGLPYQLVGNRGLFDQEEVRILIFFLRVVVDSTDSVSLFHFLHTDIFSLPPQSILSLIQQAKAKRVPLWDIVKQQSDSHYQQVVSLITQAQQFAVKHPPTKLLFSFLADSNFIKQFINQETLDSALKIKNINLFLRLVKQFETESASRRTTVVELVEFLDLLEEAGENPAQAEIEDIDTIRLITVHSAKGLEFPVVFIPSLVTGRFPATNRRDPIEFPDSLIKETLPQGNANLQEERRLFYVGLTRARDYLFLTWAKDYGGVRNRYPSGFLSETKLNQIEVGDNGQLSLLDSLSISPPKVTQIKSGQIALQYVSYSQIDTFKTCPLKYKYRYLLQVPAAPHHALSFGQSVHDTLKHFHTLEQKDLKLSLKDLLSLYQRFFREEGYDSSEHKQQRFQAGKKALKQYFKVYKTKLGTPVELEKSFRLTIAGIPLIGKIDRIDKMDGQYEIVDYKTGESQDKKQVDIDEQLSIYALGAKHALNFTPQKLSLYFLEGNQKVSTTRSPKDLDNTIERLEHTITQMKTSHFPPKPGYPFPCAYCEYNRICPYATKKK